MGNRLRRTPFFSKNLLCTLFIFLNNYSELLIFKSWRASLAKRIRFSISVEFCKRAQSSSFRRPLFSKTFWVQRTDLVSYFSKLCISMLWKPSPKMHSVNSVGFCKRAQSANFRRPLFSKTFWVQRTDREWWQVTSQGKPLSRALLPTLIRPGRGGQIKSFGSELKLKISESASKLIHADSDGQNVCFFAFLK